MTLGGKQRNNESEISALFLSGKQRAVYSHASIFIGDPTLILSVPARNKAISLLSSQHHDNIRMGANIDSDIFVNCSWVETRWQ